MSPAAAAAAIDCHIVATHTCAVIIAQQGALELTARSLHPTHQTMDSVVKV